MTYNTAFTGQLPLIQGVQFAHADLIHSLASGGKEEEGEPEDPAV